MYVLRKLIGLLSYVPARRVPGLELPSHRHIDLRHRDHVPEIDEARDAVARVGNAAWYDAGKMLTVRIDVERNAVRADPAPQPAG